MCASACAASWSLIWVSSFLICSGRHANPWAADLYDRARARGHDHPHAVRIPGRAWLNVIWHLWQGHTAHDPTKHHALQHLLTNPTQEAPAAAG